MHQFKDSAGRTWQIDINVTTIRHVRDLVKVDIAGLFDDQLKPLMNLLGDPVQFIDVLYVLVKKQADAAGLSDEDFGRGFNGDAIEDATTAFTEELGFFSQPGQRKAIQELLRKGKAIASRIENHNLEVLEKFDLEAAAARLIASYGGPPASSELTPAHSP